MTTVIITIGSIAAIVGVALPLGLSSPQEKSTMMSI